jgi:hypothetical protein
MTEKLLEVTDEDILLDADTPQGQARLWLIDSDPTNVDPCTYITLHQRYALATLYYASNGDEWIDNTEWLQGQHECDWTKVSCDASLMLTELVIGRFSMIFTTVNQCAKTHLLFFG